MYSSRVHQPVDLQSLLLLQVSSSSCKMQPRGISGHSLVPLVLDIFLILLLAIGQLGATTSSEGDAELNNKRVYYARVMSLNLIEFVNLPREYSVPLFSFLVLFCLVFVWFSLSLLFSRLFAFFSFSFATSLTDSLYFCLFNFSSMACRIQTDISFRSLNTRIFVKRFCRKTL